MPKKLAIDWDQSELRLVAAQCSGGSVKVTDAAVIPIESGSDVAETLRAAITRRGLEKTETLVAIGRGTAELRELKLPPVPAEELPEMVRFQAIRSFASAGERATVDFLVTGRSDTNIEVIAAAIGPTKLDEVRRTCEAAGLTAQRITLRPLNSASLFLSKGEFQSGDTVLIDLLADDAEIVIARDGKVIFVRTVRLPGEAAARPGALAGELRRSLVACGSVDSSRRVILWGRQSVHRDDVEKISEATNNPVETLDPFELVDVDRKLRPDLPDHVGRLAPLVGLLASDDAAADWLIDFLNPRRRPEPVNQRTRNALLVGVPAVLVAAVAWLGYSQLASLDQQIAALEAANAQQEPQVEAANQSVSRTDRIDEFLDGNVNWLIEMRRVADSMPPSEEMIVRSISGNSDPRSGGGRIQISGSVSAPAVIDDFETAMRDEHHRVVGEGANEQKTEDAYRWGFRETIVISPELVRERRYAALLGQTADPPPQAVSDEAAESGADGEAQ